jgi:hypothetical protein
MSEFSYSRSRGHHEGSSGGHEVQGRSPGKQTLVEQAPIQLRAEAAHPGGDEGSSTPDVHALAGQGTATAGGRLPHFDVVQAAFGHHDLSGLIAHTGDEAADTAKKMGAKGYIAGGRHVVLGPGADLFTVAHEASHFIEQQHGLVHLLGGVGAVGDVHEQRADAVAAKVVAGESVEGLLDQYVGKAGGTKVASAETGPVQQQKTELAAAQEAQIPAKLDNARKFERKLGIAAFSHGATEAAATTMIDRLLAAVIPGFDGAEAEHQQAYGELFGKENLGDNNPDRANGAWSSGQVGTEFAVLREAMTHGNLREKMTGIYNASLGGFKSTVKWLMDEDRSEMVARGLDDKKLARRKNQMKFNPGAKDLFRDPGNPLDRKKYSSYEHTGITRIANDDDGQKTTRTVGELDAEGIGLSNREKNYQYGTTAVDADERLKWKEGGTYFRVNEQNKWVKKYQEKLLMPVTAGPSGTAMRMFQAWEYVSKPVAAVDFRLALLGWMLTGNDHSFHEIMTTSADFGPPYTPGLDAYRTIDPLTPAELLAIAGNEGFPDEANYRTDHVSKPGPLPDPRITTGTQASILSTVPQVDKFEQLITTGTAFPGVNGGDVARAMALLVYTDDKNFGDDHTSAFQFINNVLKGNANWWTMYYFIRKDPALKAAYEANRFSIKELLDEAKLHAKLAVEGLQLLPIFAGQVFRGYRSNSLPAVGEIMSENKIVSMSKHEAVSEGFATNPDSRGRYQILCRMASTRGRDLGAASMAGPGEAEVLFAPGSRFRVQTAPVAWAPGGADGYEVTLQEA